jgi:uncharacterized protein (TIGR02001 family)
MKRASTVAAALVLVFSAVAADAQEEESGGPGFVGSVSFTTEYILRGVSQSDDEPAVQGNIDFVAGGFYAGIWGSSIEITDLAASASPVELDFYLGYVWARESGWSWELGAIHYEYPRDEVLDYEEVYGAVAYKVFKLKYYYSDDFLGLGGAGHYLDGTLKAPLGGSGFTLELHAGLNAFDDEVPIKDYTDYRGGLSYTWNNFTIGASYTDTDENQFGDLDDDRVIGLVTLTM